MSGTSRKDFVTGFLAHTARVAAFFHLLSALCPASRSAARNFRRELQEWEREGLVESVVPTVRLPIAVSTLYLDRPGEPLPNCEALARENRERWASVRPRQSKVVFATPKLLRRAGGVAPGRIENEDGLAHDLGLAALLLQLHSSDPGLLRAFVSEDALPQRKGSVNPDGYFATAGGPFAVLEMCGSSYGSDRFADLVAFARGEGLELHLFAPAPEGQS